MVRAKKVKNWVITRAEFDTDPKHLAKVTPSGLMPYDSAFMFDAKDCIRTKETAYSPDGVSRFSTASLRRKAAWSKPPESARSSKRTAGRDCL